LAFQLRARLVYLWKVSNHWQRHLDPTQREPWIWVTPSDLPGAVLPTILVTPHVRREEPQFDIGNISDSEAETQADDDSLGEG
jgi:hypothetical protein